VLMVQCWKSVVDTLNTAKIMQCDDLKIRSRVRFTILKAGDDPRGVWRRKGECNYEMLQFRD
jgi:hypothetical protein